MSLRHMRVACHGSAMRDALRAMRCCGMRVFDAQRVCLRGSDILICAALTRVGIRAHIYVT